MPAIPVQGRVEAHLTDDELSALHDFLDYAISTHQGSVYPSPMVVAAGGNQRKAGVMFGACRELAKAVRRTLKERAA